MKSIGLRKVLVLLTLALVIWATCGAVMYAGMAFTSLTGALIIHAVAAPIIATVVAWIYFRRFHYTSPLGTAGLFTAIVILMDVFVVALLIQGSFAMFSSILGTWIPFALIFAATYLTGRQIEKANQDAISISMRSVN